MPGFAEVMKSDTLATIIRITLLAFAGVSGIVGTIVTQNVNSTLDKVTRTETEILVLTHTADEARAEATASSVAVQTLRTESTRRFDSLDSVLKEHGLELQQQTLEVYKLDLRVKCLEHKVVCP